jgi:hypothetical protein
MEKTTCYKSHDNQLSRTGDFFFSLCIKRSKHSVKTFRPVAVGSSRASVGGNKTVSISVGALAWFADVRVFFFSSAVARSVSERETLPRSCEPVTRGVTSKLRLSGR